MNCLLRRPRAIVENEEPLLQEVSFEETILQLMNSCSKIVKPAVIKQLGRIEHEALCAVIYDFFPGEAEAKCIYAVYERELGAGPIRLGRTLKPTEDIYALLLASNFKLGIVENHRWEAWKRNEKATQEFEAYY